MKGHLLLEGCLRASPGVSRLVSVGLIWEVSMVTSGDDSSVAVRVRWTGGSCAADASLLVYLQEGSFSD